MPEGRILFAATSSLDAIIWTVTKKEKNMIKNKIELKSNLMFELITYFVQGKFYDNHHTLAQRAIAKYVWPINTTRVCNSPSLRDQ